MGADPAAGVPPTYAAVYALFPTFGQLLEDREAAVDMRMLVHSEQEFEWSRHPEVGETLAVTGEVAEDVARRGMRFITMVATCRDAAGADVCRSRMVCIVRAS